MGNQWIKQSFASCINEGNKSNQINRNNEFCNHNKIMTEITKNTVGYLTIKAISIIVRYVCSSKLFSTEMLHKLFPKDRKKSFFFVLILFIPAIP